MRIKRLSTHVLYCENFLPQKMLDDVYMDILQNRTKFDLEQWGDGSNTFDGVSVQFLNHNCGGMGFWIGPEDQQKMERTPVLALNEYFFHQGIISFATQQKNMVFVDTITRPMSFSVHYIAYNNGGYYNWHKDKIDGTIFTFNLVLNKGNKLKGGDMLFMDDGEMFEIPNQDNIMVAFPSWVDHAITPLKSDDGKDVPFLEQRFSIQYQCSLDGQK
jgi:hypothetical protein|tara:strand:- start:2407 stop:3054 length:648 start_codon:yes stop_codon:yes gene_type:complete